MAGVSRLAVRPCRPNPRLGAVDFFVGLWKGQRATQRLLALSGWTLQKALAGARALGWPVMGR